MNWKYVRLELARTRDFPQGSASRSYLLRLPIREDGLIDEKEVLAAPDQATVRRHWPSQPDRIGHVVQTPTGWAFSYEAGEEQDETVCHLDPRPIRCGEHITLTEPDGRRLPFRVATLRELRA